MPTYITVADAAERLGLTRQRIHQIMRQLELTPQRVLGRVVFTRSQLAAIRDREKGQPGRPQKKNGQDAE